MVIFHSYVNVYQWIVEGNFTNGGFLRCRDCYHKNGGERNLFFQPMLDNGWINGWIYSI
jgi:hypothetical protein